MICLEVNSNNTDIMLKKWERLYINSGKSEDIWHQFLGCDKQVGGVIVNWDNTIGSLHLIGLKPYLIHISF